LDKRNIYSEFAVVGRSGKKQLKTSRQQESRVALEYHKFKDFEIRKNVSAKTFAFFNARI